MNTSMHSSFFLISGVGQIKSGSFPGVDDLYVKLSYVYGPDWSVIAGIEDGITQISKKSADGKGTFVWNFPLELTLKSSNPYGWPQLVLSVFGPDFFGNDVVRGYGVCHLPTSPGKCEKRVPMFVPVSSSPLQKLVSYFTGRKPEFVDPRVVARGEGREMTLVASQGFVDVEFQIKTKDLQKLGYEVKS